MARSYSVFSKRLYLAISAVLVLVLLYQIIQEDALLHPNRQLDEALGNELPLIPDATNNPLLADAQSELVRAQQALNRPAVESTPKGEALGNDEVVPAPDAWRIADASGGNPTMPLPGGVVVYEPVSVDMESPAYPEAGQQTSVTLPGGEQFRVNVKSNNVNPNGDYSWRGHLDGHGDEYPVVMTYGGNSVFATVTTPKGSYTLESVGGSGWIYKNPSEFELSHPGARDFLEIPHEH